MNLINNVHQINPVVPANANKKDVKTMINARQDPSAPMENVTHAQKTHNAWKETSARTVDASPPLHVVETVSWNQISMSNVTMGTTSRETDVHLFAQKNEISPT